MVKLGGHVEVEHFKNCLAAAIFDIDIFDITTPVSDYLQTSGLDITQAWHVNNITTENVEKIIRNSSDIFKTTSNFALHANLKLKEVNISVPKSFSIIRFSRLAPEDITDQKTNFEVS